MEIAPYFVHVRGPADDVLSIVDWMHRRTDVEFFNLQSEYKPGDNPNWLHPLLQLHFPDDAT